MSGGRIVTGESDSHETSERSLAGIELLKMVSPEELAAVERACQWEHHKPGSWLFERGQETSHVYFIIEGTVRVLNYSSSGRVMWFASVGPGGLLGELSAMDGLPRSATVVADRPSFMAKYPAKDFRNLVETVPEFASALIRRMAEIIRDFDEQIINLSGLTASQRVCLQLLRLAEPDPVSSDSWLVYPLPTQTVLAGEAGTTRETVARVFGRLTEKGLIHRKGRSLYIHDRQTLENMAVREAAEYLLAGKR